MEATDHSHTSSDHTESVYEWLKVGVLVTLGIYFAYNIVSGNLTNYVNARFAWLSYVAAVMFLVIAAASSYVLIKSRKTHEHHHTHLSWKVILITAIPLVVGTLVPSRPLGAEAINGNYSVSAASSTNADYFGTDPLKRNVLDWLRAFNQEAIASFEGQQADIVGFVYREASFAENNIMVVRFTISCCVADASAIGLPVVWDKAPNISQDTWVRVKGSFHIGEFQGDKVPILQATSVEIVPQPEHPYLYP